MKKKLAEELEKNNIKRQEIAKAVKKAIEKEIRALEKLKKSKFDFTPEEKHFQKILATTKVD